MRTAGAASQSGVQERDRVRAMMETLAQLQARGETLAEVAHDARNMVTALTLYCDLLEEPGVLNEGFRHYGGELRLLASASRRLVEKLIELDNRPEPFLPKPVLPERSARSWRPEPYACLPITDLAAELEANRNLLSALAGPATELRLEKRGGGWPVRLSSEDLTRVLVNLIKNSAEAMPRGGAILIRLGEEPAGAGALPTLALSIEDNGPGIPAEALERIFEAGFSSHRNTEEHGRAVGRRGLGLSITRSIIEAAGGRIWAENLLPHGARIVLELPVRSG